MQNADRALRVAAASAVLIACRGSVSVGTEPSTTPPTATASVPTLATAPFGRATVQPDNIKPGSTFTVTLAMDIQPICLHMAEVYTRTEPLRFAGALGSDGPWQPSSPSVPVTYPPCQMPRSKEPARFMMPTGVPAGDYVVCIKQSHPAKVLETKQVAVRCLSRIYDAPFKRRWHYRRLLWPRAVTASGLYNLDTCASPEFMAR